MEMQEIKRSGEILCLLMQVGYQSKTKKVKRIFEKGVQKKEINFYLHFYRKYHLATGNISNVF